MWLLTFVASLLASSSPNATWTTTSDGDEHPLTPPSTPEEPFWDMQSFQADERERLLRKALDITELEGYIDWDLLHDNYVNAVLDSTAAKKKTDASSTMNRRRLEENELDTDEDDAERDSEEKEEDEEEESDFEEEEEEDNEEEDVNIAEDRQLTSHRIRRRKHHKRRRHRRHRTSKRIKKRTSEQIKALTTTATAPATTTSTTSTNFGSSSSILIPVYNYSLGNCPGTGNSPLAVPCAPSNLKDICDKYSSQGSFRNCLTTCEPSFCCIHNAPDATNTYAPNCNTDINCAQWAYCYIAWWKLADHIGPATRLRVEQHDPFYDIPATEITGILQSNLVFYKQFLFHFFRDSAKVIQLGTVQVNSTLSNFNIDRIILNSTYWNTTI